MLYAMSSMLRSAGRYASAVILLAVISSPAQGAVILGSPGTSPTYPLGSTDYVGRFNFLVKSPFWPLSPVSVFIGPPAPASTSTGPTQQQSITPLPPAISFPKTPVLPIGPPQNPFSVKPVAAAPVSAPSSPPTSTAADVSAVVDGDNQFAYDLYGTLSNTNTGNMVFSPYSISTALAMTYAGAAGQTAKEMAQTLHFTLPQDQLHPAMGQLINQINSQDGSNYQLSVANHLWGQTGFPFLSSFVNTTSADYQAPLTQLDFVGSTEASRKTINTWTANQTNQKIQDLLPQGSVTQDTRLVLTNAVYFKGQWQSAFDSNLTKPETFHLSSGSLESVPMMHQEGTFKYGDFKDFSMLDMPYKGGDISMVAILPSQSSSLSSVEKSLNLKTLNQDEGQLANTRVEVGLPKFTMTSQFGLARTLANMGMPSAFGRSADFSGMDGKHDLSISDVIHKAFVNVDEQGTEAAGATGVIMGSMCGCMPPLLRSATFDADRPFDFLIRDDKSGSILFMGRVSDPGGTPIVTPLPEDSFFSSTLDGTLLLQTPGISTGGTTLSPGSFYPSGAGSLTIGDPAAFASGLPVLSSSGSLTVFSGSNALSLSRDGQLSLSRATLNLAPVPEPSTWALLIAASIALTTIARIRGDTVTR